MPQAIEIRAYSSSRMNSPNEKVTMRADHCRSLSQPFARCISVLGFFLTFVLLSLYSPLGHASCSTHDHGCIFHGFDSAVHTTYVPPTGSTPSSLVVYAIGTNPDGTPSSVDFDNKVKVNEFTSSGLYPRSYSQGTGPYIINATSYGTANPPPSWNAGATDGALQVYPSQYQLTYNQNTAVARHTGDLNNGGENGNVPNATGCPNLPAGSTNCEAVVVTGNVPNGIYEQRVRIYNYPNIPNPSVNIQAGAYTTGTAILITNSHAAPKPEGPNELANFTTLTGTGAISDTYKYEFYDPKFNPHAQATAYFDRTRQFYTAARNTYEKRYDDGSYDTLRDRYLNTHVTRTNIGAQGGSYNQLIASYSRKVDPILVAHVDAPKPIVQLPEFTLALTGEGTTQNPDGSVNGVLIRVPPPLCSICSIKNALPFFDFNNGGFYDSMVNITQEGMETALYNSKVKLGTDFSIRYPTTSGRVSGGNQYFITFKAGTAFKVGGYATATISQGIDIASAYKFDDGGVIGENTAVQSAGAVGSIGGGVLFSAIAGTAIAGTACAATIICGVAVVGVTATVGSMLGESAEETAVRWQLNNFYK